MTWKLSKPGFASVPRIAAAVTAAVAVFCLLEPAGKEVTTKMAKTLFV